MECKKCNIDIPSQFEFALSKNVCPKCGHKLMADQAMKVYIDLKRRLGEVEFVMDKGVVCERIAMFVVSNYEVIPLKQIPGKPKKAPQISATDVEETESVEVDLDDPLSGMTPEEIRAEVEEEARLAALGREFGMELSGDEEMVSNSDEDRESRIERLKSMAGGKSGVMVRRVSPGE